MSVKCMSRLALFFLILLANSLVNAQALQDVGELEIAANTWLDQQLSQEEGRYEARFSSLDPRLRLTACESPLVVELHGSNDLRGRLNLKVSCLDQDWFVYLGVNLARYLTVVVAKTDLPRKAKLSSPMLSLVEKDVSRVRGDYFTSLAEVTGFQLRNRLRAGDVLSSKNLLETDAVNRSEQITIVATNGVLSVRMGGEALDSGKVGDQIRVRNLQSGRVIRALVVGRGKVEVRY
ncbi:flagellar basal body P-ring formation chaperone FlgA [Marinospirillum insulare]|uniref:Flagella basal body P-ring formation protein FlgA n=1 Tax=Marinospirillum insulare TaxID=217169 RepID=A0ABQ6A3D6_9GAMM|nr:flagellar basal body P-ring formation chaperone FlgA [Marinospirillum insulare]GLR64604.1 flagella basal body P-ring formation protein FlgA [Marinospirillum insulare]